MHDAGDAFELEVLLRGLACVVDRRNWPGGPSRNDVLSKGGDWRGVMALVASVLTRSSMLCAALTRSSMLGAASKSTVNNLARLERSLRLFGELGVALASGEALSRRRFLAFSLLVQNEIESRGVFVPNHALQFPESLDASDALAPEDLASLAELSPGESLWSVGTFAMKVLRRFDRYVALVEQAIRSTDRAVDTRLATVQLTLCVLRVELRAFAKFLQRSSGDILARSLEAELLSLSASDVIDLRASLMSKVDRMLQLHATFHSIAVAIEADTNRIFDDDVPPLSAAVEVAGRLAATQRAALRLRVTFERDIKHLLSSASRLDQTAISAALRERMRSDAWSMRHIVHAFAQRLPTTDDRIESWIDRSPTDFVDAFLGYFRLYGLPLCHITNDDEGLKVASSVGSLRSVNGMRAGDIDRVVNVCRAFEKRLSDTFAKLDEELIRKGLAFDSLKSANQLKRRLRARAEINGSN